MSVFYRMFMKDVGWCDTMHDGEVAGNIDGGSRAEVIQIGTDSNLTIDIQVCMQRFGWLDYSAGMDGCGATDARSGIEAIRCRLWGVDYEKYDLIYRVHIPHFGWLAWAKNNEIAGSIGFDLCIDGIQAYILKVGSKRPSVHNDYPYPNVEKPILSVQSYIDGYNWVDNGVINDEDCTLQCVKCDITGQFSNRLKIIGSIHSREKGWLDEQYAKLGIGSTAEYIDPDAVYFKLLGDYAEHFDLWYRVHIQNRGWMGWTKNGMPAGTEGCSMLLNAIEIKLHPKWSVFNSDNSISYEKFEPSKGNNSRDILVNIAYSQAGLQEYDSITKYGEWFGDPSVRWSQCFISWCANESGISANTIPYVSDIQDAIDFFIKENRFHLAKDGYTAQVGDLIYFDLNEDGFADHVGIVADVAKGGFITTIEGNAGYPPVYVQVKKWSEKNKSIYGYGLPF